MRQDGHALRPRILGLLLLQTAFLFLSGGLQTIWAERIPSTELTFHLSFAPDSITVGDPIRVEIAGSAPEEGVLLFPTFADSIGPFAILDAPPLVREISEGRVRIEQQLDPAPRKQLAAGQVPRDVLFAAAGLRPGQVLVQLVDRGAVGLVVAAVCLRAGVDAGGKWIHRRISAETVAQLAQLVKSHHQRAMDDGRASERP